MSPSKNISNTNLSTNFFTNFVSKPAFLIVVITIVFCLQNLTVAKIVELSGMAVINYQPSLMVFGLPIALLILGFGSILAYYLNKYLRVPFVLLWIIGVGAVSNLLEFITFGYVVDYFDITIAVLNIADLLIYTGLILILWNYLFNKTTTIEKIEQQQI